MALGPFGESDPLDAARIAAEAAAGPAARLRAHRPPPIWVDRPRGSYGGATLLGALSILGVALLLYDLELVGRSAPMPTAGNVTFVSPTQGWDDWYWIAVRYDSEEALLAVQSPRPPGVGESIRVTTHVRYFRRHVHSLFTEGSPTPFFVEPPHTLGVNGLIGGVAATLCGALAIVQWRLTRAGTAKPRLDPQPPPMT